MIVDINGIIFYLLPLSSCFMGLSARKDIATITFSPEGSQKAKW